MVRIPPPRKKQPAAAPSSEVVGLEDLLGLIQSVAVSAQNMASGAAKVDLLARAATTPQGRAAAALSVASGFAKSAGMDRDMFLAMCAMAYDK